MWHHSCEKQRASPGAKRDFWGFTMGPNGAKNGSIFDRKAKTKNTPKLNTTAHAYTHIYIYTGVLPHYPPLLPKQSYPTIHLYPPPLPRKTSKITTSPGGNELCEIYGQELRVTPLSIYGLATIHVACSIRGEKRG